MTGLAGAGYSLIEFGVEQHTVLSGGGAAAFVVGTHVARHLLHWFAKRQEASRIDNHIQISPEDYMQDNDIQNFSSEENEFSLSVSESDGSKTVVKYGSGS